MAISYPIKIRDPQALGFLRHIPSERTNQMAAISAFQCRFLGASKAQKAIRKTGRITRVITARPAHATLG